MSSANEISKSVGRKLETLMSGKPIWVFWAVYTVLSGVILGVSYTLLYLVASRWWVAAIVVIAAGMIWGTLTHKTKDTEKKEE